MSYRCACLGLGCSRATHSTGWARRRGWCRNRVRHPEATCDECYYSMAKLATRPPRWSIFDYWPGHPIGGLLFMVVMGGVIWLGIVLLTVLVRILAGN